jgi:hypothetical protein
MWGCSANYPSIRSYGDAARAYANTQPLRGKPHFRPLDARSSRAKSQIIKDGEDYVIKLYNTEIVRYKADGTTMLRHGGWVTQATAGAISAMGPVTAWCSSGNLVVSPTLRRMYAEGHHKFIVPQEGLVFSNEGVPVNPPVAVVRKTRVRREQAKLVRAYFKQVPKLMEAYAAVAKGGDAQRDHQRPITKADMTEEPLSEEPLSEELASEIAMGWLKCDYHWREQKYVYTGGARVTGFWNQAYQVFDLVEAYEIPLPYGEVP